ncbi:hypothetical protein L228DRAFT_262547 [Xylona heveae TC161]|uniref:Early meiotic induction protein 1 n=1 Tax=Xylona heveae (strain CBS 132557 / TC161) TaxID=1328760 RepID=A0A165AK22_XYLHT|nr:hypothetical protein L228DRAFT_262547 [Xylona heveae TC161]KZF20613.1 hypothetical protein L228DRAFT_262547 [Xylona heveae TC161]
MERENTNDVDLDPPNPCKRDNQSSEISVAVNLRSSDQNRDEDDILSHCQTCKASYNPAFDKYTSTMGWWWSGSGSAKTSAEPTPDKPAAEAAPAIPINPPSPTNTAPEKPSQPLSREEQAESDLNSLILQLREEERENQGIPPLQKDGSTPATSSTSNPSSLYPTTMSCRQSFDQAFYCQSPGGQFMNVYRYGDLRDCSELWSQFWFCMRTKSYSEAKRKTMIQEHYMERAIKYKLGSSSEDVWESRTEPIRGAFQEDPDAE